jgi:hypothetical protein
VHKVSASPHHCTLFCPTKGLLRLVGNPVSEQDLGRRQPNADPLAPAQDKLPIESPSSPGDLVDKVSEGPACCSAGRVDEPHFAKLLGLCSDSSWPRCSGCTCSRRGGRSLTRLTHRRDRV